MSYRITLARCPAGHRTYPARPDCPACGRDATTEKEESHGHIFTWTRVERPPEGFDGPQTVVVVRLERADGEEMPPLVIAGWDSAEVMLGQAVRIRDDADRLVAEPVQ